MAKQAEKTLQGDDERAGRVELLWLCGVFSLWTWLQRLRGGEVLRPEEGFSLPLPSTPDPLVQVIGQGWSSGMGSACMTLLALMALLFCLFAPAARAQVMDNNIEAQPEIRVATPLPPKRDDDITVPAFNTPQAVFPTGFGALSWLRKRGVNYLLSNTNEFAGAITKPTKGFPTYKQGASNAGQTAMSLDVNWEQILGMRGFATHVITVGRYGTTANRMFGDWLNHASEDYGGGGNVVVHLVTAYGEETLFGARLSIAAGRLGEMANFESSPLFCNFQNGSMCGRPKAATDNPYVSGYPGAVWGGRIRGRPQRFIYLQTGAYAAEEGIYGVAQHRTGFKYNGATIHGVRLPFEAGWEPVFQNKFPGHYKVGAVLMTAPTADNYRDASGQPYVLTGRKPAMKRNTYGAWFMLDQQLLNHYHDKKRGLIFMTGFLYNDASVALREWETYAALIDRGIFRSRPYDTFGIAFTYERMPHGVQRTDALLLHGRHSAPYGSMPNHATGIQRHASVLEVNYAVHVARGIIVQPLLEYFVRPNGQGNLRNAALLGCKTMVEIF
ncbi:carbohydrate porin [Oecophyllibacter saccharovorans]|uniref:carbohydrate porin n=1 Tax=Oecophyllibacter saccharovorans TaxID=2558360 RepID=UPI001F501D93|nr:carbohydrate porin [Oecophyllibacter saccharovorans]